MLLPPPLLHPRRTKSRKPPAPSAGPPPAPPVSVVSVSVVDEQWADWAFSLPVTMGVQTVAWSVIEIDTTNGTQSASEGLQVSPMVVWFYFDDGGVAAGQAWRLTGQTPPQLDLHGAQLVAPASGIVEEE